MDRVLAPAAGWLRRVPWMSALAGLAALLAAVAWWGRPVHLQRVHDVQLATVRAGEFRDDLPLKARVEPLRSVQLDAPEAGRVEAVLAREGDTVAAGAPLYRLHSPEQEQLLMQRGAEVAQQTANVSAQRSAQVASLALARRERAQLLAAAQQAEVEHQRTQRLAAEGFVSAAALEQSQRQAQLAAELLHQAVQDQALEADIRQQSLNEMSRAVQGLQRGLQLLDRARDRLLQRAPMAGRVSGLQLQVGATVRPGERLGRIDDPQGGTQLVAEVDEFYLPRLAIGLAASSPQGALRLAQTLPQVQAGKLRVQLHWTGAPPPDLRPGQTLDVRLQLGAPRQGLLLPDAPGIQNTLYVRQGAELHRRTVQLGRRAAGQVEVLAGLQAGDTVLISLPPHVEAERFALP